MIDSMPRNAASRRVPGGSGRLRSSRSTSAIARIAGMAPDNAICAVYSLPPATVFAASIHAAFMAFSVSTELPAARHRLIHTTGMLRVLAILGLLIGLAPTAHAGRGTNLVKYLPDDANVIVIADVARARRSPIFKKVFEAARS